MKILKSQEARERLSIFLNKPFDSDGREYDTEQVFIKLKEVNEEVKIGKKVLVLKDMKLWDEAIFCIEDIIRLNGYEWNETLSDLKESTHVYVSEKNRNYSDYGVLRIFVHLTKLISKYGCSYEEYIETIKDGMTAFEYYDSIELEKNPDSDYYENLEVFYDNLFNKNFN